MNKIYVVGIGPGAYEKMTIEAAEALKASDTIIGYTVYVDLVKDHFADKRFLTTPMTKEVDRCVLAFEEAKKGHVVSMICSGDAGVSNMGRGGEAGRVLALKELRDTAVDMFTTVFIGNSQTKALAGKMVTPRGYRDV